MIQTGQNPRPPLHRRFVACLLVALCVAASACSSADADKQRHIERGNQYFDEQRYADAIIEYRGAIQIDDKFGPARSRLADAYAATGQPEYAYREAMRAADLMPTDPQELVKAARYLLLARQFLDAKTYLQRALDIEPRNIEALVMLGNALAGLRDLDGALSELEEAIQLDPNRVESLASLALIRYAQGERELAGEAFQKAIAIDPTSVTAWLSFANFQWAVGEIAAGEESLKKALALDPTHVLTNKALAVLYIVSNRTLLAEPHLKAIVDVTSSPQARFAMADYYAVANRPDEARAILEPMTRRSVTFTGAQSRLARLEYVAGRTAIAHALLDEILQREPNNAFALITRAQWLLGEGKRAQALQAAKAAVAADPQSARAQYLLGAAHAARRENAAAINAFLQASRINPRLTAVKTQVSRLYLDRGAIDSAVQMGEEAVLLAPGNVDARLALARAWIARGDPGDVTRASSVLIELKRAFPDVAAVYSLTGSLRMLEGNSRAAREAYVVALELSWALLEPLRGITTLDIEAGKMADARARIEARLAADPENWELRLLASTVYIAADDLPRAESTLRAILESDATIAEAYSQLGKVLFAQNKLDAAYEEFLDKVRRFPESVSANTMLGMILHWQNKLPEAKKQYERVLTLEPSSAVVANNLAWLYADQRENFSRAQELAELAADQLPTQAEVQDTLGWVHYQKGVPGLAIGPFQRSVALQPDNAIYRYHLGLAYAANRNAEEAIQSFRTAVQLKPDYTEARQALAAAEAQTRAAAPAPAAR